MPLASCLAARAAASRRPNGRPRDGQGFPAAAFGRTTSSTLRTARRLRDWHTLTTQAASVTIIGPTFLRSGLVLSVLGTAALVLNQFVDTAPTGSWLYG
ncbi:DUF6336 family protein [Streptomyces sp. NPDC057794]|uniref:DUF6336 family protein n=1 Tax=Streptomyces sp. NPDC057794 TaxID=3346251 RepID=UPI0036C4481F